MEQFELFLVYALASFPEDAHRRVEQYIFEDSQSVPQAMDLFRTGWARAAVKQKSFLPVEEAKPSTETSLANSQGFVKTLLDELSESSSSIALIRSLQSAVRPVDDPVACIRTINEANNDCQSALSRIYRHIDSNWREQFHCTEASMAADVMSYRMWVRKLRTHWKRKSVAPTSCHPLIDVEYYGTPEIWEGSADREEGPSVYRGFWLHVVDGYKFSPSQFGEQEKAWALYQFLLKASCLKDLNIFPWPVHAEHVHNDLVVATEAVSPKSSLRELSSPALQRFLLLNPIVLETWCAQVLSALTLLNQSEVNVSCQQGLQFNVRSNGRLVMRGISVLDTQGDKVGLLEWIREFVQTLAEILYLSRVVRIPTAELPTVDSEGGDGGRLSSRQTIHAVCTSKITIASREGWSVKCFEILSTADDGQPSHKVDVSLNASETAVVVSCKLEGAVWIKISWKSGREEVDSAVLLQITSMPSSNSLRILELVAAINTSLTFVDFEISECIATHAMQISNYQIKDEDLEAVESSWALFLKSNVNK